VHSMTFGRAQVFELLPGAIRPKPHPPRECRNSIEAWLCPLRIVAITLRLLLCSLCPQVPPSRWSAELGEFRICYPNPGDANGPLPGARLTIGEKSAHGPLRMN
jgi:hypothetical protein